MNYIVPDDFHGIQHITQQLIDAGHLDIGFFGNPYKANKIIKLSEKLPTAFVVAGNENVGNIVLTGYGNDERAMAQTGVSMPMDYITGN